ncbi:MAG: hypothetical protein AB7D51_11370 [Desulfovibrionaceae bacterium]
MSDAARCTIKIALDAARAKQFASLLQHGFLQPVSGPVPIRDFLVGLPGFTPEYIESEVQTIFHNGVAADNLDDLLYAGDTLALSAAMPGLAGAIFRRAGVHASLRARVAEAAHEEPGREGFVLVKLYNQIGADRVGDVLRGGVRISGRALAGFVRRREDLFGGATRLCAAEQRLADERFLEHLCTQEQVELSTLPAG